MYVVASAEPFQRITCPGKKPDPLAVTTKPGLPALTDAGVTLSRLGARTRNSTWFEATPGTTKPVLNTYMLASFAPAIELAGTAAVS